MSCRIGKRPTGGIDGNAVRLEEWYRWFEDWTEDATAARYDHAERVEELRAAVEKANNPGKEKAPQKAG